MLEVIIPIILLFIFLAIGMPVALSMGISGAIGLYMTGGLQALLSILETTPTATVASYTLVVAPLFILMAEFLSRSNIIQDLFESANKWFGFLPGGLALATVFSGAFLGALSGSSTASAATLSNAAVPQMKRHGYSAELALGVVSISGTLSILIPPSTVFIVYGIVTESPIDQLFIAGILPGILTATGYIIIISIWAKMKPQAAPRAPNATIREKFSSLKLVWPILLLIVLVLGGIYTGLVTIVEAAGLAAFGAFIIPLVMRRFTFKKVNESLGNAIKINTMIFTILIGGYIFSYYLSYTQITSDLISFIGGLNVSPIIIMLIIVVIYLILGLFMNQFAILVLTLPVTFPLAMSLGYDPIWFGVIVAKAAEIGLCTPPMGLNVFVAAGTVKEKASTGFKGVTPFFIVDIVILLLLVLFPMLSLYLPSLM